MLEDFQSQAHHKRDLNSASGSSVRAGRSVRRVRCSYGVRMVSRAVFGTVFYGAVRCRTVSYGVVRCFVRSPVRVSYGVRTESKPYATYGAPPSEPSSEITPLIEPLI